jgi:hypothetical protein
MDTSYCHKIDIYDDEKDKEEWVTMGDEEEKFILLNEKESTKDSSKVSHATWFLLLCLEFLYFITKYVMY